MNAHTEPYGKVKTRIHAAYFDKDKADRVAAAAEGPLTICNVVGVEVR